MKINVIDEQINKAYDYIVAVLKCQKKWLDFNEMYQGYKSSFKISNQMNKNFFEITYNEIKSICNDNPNFFKTEKE